MQHSYGQPHVYVPATDHSSLNQYGYMCTCTCTMATSRQQVHAGWLASWLYRSCQCTITRTTCTQTRASQPQTVTTVRVGRTAGCLAGRYLVATCWVHDGSEHSCSYMHSRHAHVHVHVATRICTCSSTRTSPTTQQDAVTSLSALSDVATASAHNHTLSNVAKL